MTREEAIVVLKEIKNYFGRSIPHLALDMAIAALREQETVTKCHDLYDEDGGEILNRAESDTVKPGWISVEERLPEDMGDVLVRAFWHEKWGVRAGWYSDHTECWHILTASGDHARIEVTHWMPLPEPPEVEV